MYHLWYLCCKRKQKTLNKQQCDKINVLCKSNTMKQNKENHEVVSGSFQSIYLPSERSSQVSQVSRIIR